MPSQVCPGAQILKLSGIHSSWRISKTLLCPYPAAARLLHFAIYCHVLLDCECRQCVFSVCSRSPKFLLWNLAPTGHSKTVQSGYRCSHGNHVSASQVFLILICIRFYSKEVESAATSRKQSWLRPIQKHMASPWGQSLAQKVGVWPKLISTEWTLSFCFEGQALFLCLTAFCPNVRSGVAQLDKRWCWHSKEGRGEGLQRHATKPCPASRTSGSAWAQSSYCLQRAGCMRKWIDFAVEGSLSWIFFYVRLQCLSAGNGWACKGPDLAVPQGCLKH